MSGNANEELQLRRPHGPGHDHAPLPALDHRHGRAAVRAAGLTPRPVSRAGGAAPPPPPCRSPCPTVAFMTCAGEEPLTLSSPPTKRAHSSALAAITSSSTAPRVSDSEGLESHLLGQGGRVSPAALEERAQHRLGLGRGELATRLHGEQGGERLGVQMQSRLALGRDLVGGAGQGQGRGRARVGGRRHQRVQAQVDDGVDLVHLGVARRPAECGTPERPGGPPASGPARRAPAPATPRRAPAAPGRARGSSGSRWPPPWSASNRCAPPTRPSAGSPGATVPPDSRRAIWRAASYSIARPSERREFRFLISQRVPKASVPTGRTDTLASTRIDPSSIRPSEAPVAIEDARAARWRRPAPGPPSGCRAR